MAHVDRRPLPPPHRELFLDNTFKPYPRSWQALGDSSPADVAASKMRAMAR